MATISKDTFQDAIRAAVRYRNSAYNNSFGLSVRWEHDDTDAVDDTSHFQAILSTLGLQKADEFIITIGDKTPGWSLQSKITSIFNTAKTSSGRSVVLIHYAGHGYVHQGSLWAIERKNGRTFSLDRFMLELAYADYHLSDIDNVDVVFFLDCCYANRACRAAQSTPRVVEILAATDDTSPNAFAPPKNTLTGKLRGEVARRKRDGHQFVEFAELIQTLRSKKDAIKRPSHCLKLGVSSVCLPFSGLVAVNPSTIMPTLRAVFSVHIAQSMTPEELDRFVEWIEHLPQSFSITLERAYETNSTLLILQSAYSIYSKLLGLTGISLISETTSGNIFHQSHSSSVLRSAGLPLKENVPFSKAGKK